MSVFLEVIEFPVSNFQLLSTTATDPLKKPYARLPQKFFLESYMRAIDA